MKSRHDALPADIVADLDACALQGHIGSCHYKASSQGGHQSTAGRAHPKFISDESADVLVEFSVEDVAEEHLGHCHFETLEGACKAELGAGAGRQGVVSHADCPPVRVLRADSWIELDVEFGDFDWVGDYGADDRATCSGNKYVTFLSITFLITHILQDYWI